MPTRRTWITGVVRELARARSKAGRLLVLRDLEPWLRMQFLGVASRAKILDALRQSRTAAEVSAETGLRDIELIEAFLQLGVAIGELGVRDAKFVLRGRRARALGSREADDLAGLVEELLVYDSPIYQRLEGHFANESSHDYLAGVGDVIARSSRFVEPFLGPFVASLVREQRPARVLDVGSGSGAYLHRTAEASDSAEVIGIDMDADAVGLTRSNLRKWGLEGRVKVHQADITALPSDLEGPYGMVLLLQNVYYWPPEERVGLLAQLGALAPSGTVVVATVTPAADAFSRHFDLMLRVTRGCWRLPEREELRSQLVAAGFASVATHTLAPTGGLTAIVATRHGSVDGAHTHGS